jgi:SAM-dependent methyltransferase
LLGNLDHSGIGLNVGSGDTDLHNRLINTDLYRTQATDCVANALALPFPDAAYDLVISQEAVEHIVNPFAAVNEMVRVLKPDGLLYLQVPFVIGYHPGPEDYWRFTREGVGALLDGAGLRCETLVPSVGAGTGLHRILVEFTAGIAARIIPQSYRAVKGVMALLFYPLKWLDGWLMGGAHADRIPGGYLAIGRK